MNNRQIEKFMESVRIGYTIYVSPPLAGEVNKCIVKDIYDGGVSLIPENEPWDSEPFEVDFVSIDQYRILIRAEREAPFSVELNKIVTEIEEIHEIEKINLDLLRGMMSDEDSGDYSRRVEAIWCSTNTAHEKNKFDDIMPHDYANLIHFWSSFRF